MRHGPTGDSTPAVGSSRESELRAAGAVLGVREVSMLDYGDGELHRAAAHSVSKLYYIAWSRATWAAYQEAVKRLAATVDGVERLVAPWPDWAITTTIDTRDVWPTVWRAVSCHESQVTAYGRLQDLAPEHHEGLWGRQSFYLAFSLVNGGRAHETDLFLGITS